MDAPRWMSDWRDEMLSTKPEVTIDLSGLQGWRKPRSLPDVAASVMHRVRQPLEPLTLRVGEPMHGKGLAAAFRIDLLRGAQGVRSYGIAWRRDQGTFMALQCPADADVLGDDQKWTVEVQLTASQRAGVDPVVYRAMYDHLLDRGRRLPPEQLTRVRAVNFSLARMGLELVTLGGDDPRSRPVLIQPGQPGTTWLRQVGAALVARQVLAGVMGSAHWRPHAAALLGLRPATSVVAFGRAFGWDDAGTPDPRVLESDLVRRFRTWAGEVDPSLDATLPVGELSPSVDGQIPDVAVGPTERLVVVEAKLGLERDSVRTGLAQAAEYAFHLSRSRTPAPVLLLLGEAPDLHGVAFSAFVRSTAQRLEVPVVVEVQGSHFRAWHGDGPAWAEVGRRQPRLAGALAAR